MENDFGKQEQGNKRNSAQRRPATSSSTESSSAASHADLLAELDADRAQLGQRITAPRWIAPAFGALAGLQVVGAAFTEAALAPYWILVLVAAGSVFAVVYHRSTGVKVSNWTPWSWFLLAAALVVTLTLYSVALGFESFGLLWWITAPALAAFAAVTWLVGLIIRSIAGRVLRVR